MDVTDVCEKVVADPENTEWMSREDLIISLKRVSDMDMKLDNVITLKGDALFVGDIHGDLESLLSAFSQSDERSVNIVFLGDIVDRGSHNVECVNLVLARRLLEPSRVHYLRGNHEFKAVNARWGFADDVMERYSQTIYWLYDVWFTTLPLAVLFNETTLGIHGGVGRETPTIKSIMGLNRTQLPARDEITTFLWNDPSEDITGWDINTTRGIFYNFGRDIFDEFMQANGLDLMVRGHMKQPDGVRYYFDDRLISIFSSADHYKGVKPKAVLIREDGEREVVEL